MVTWTISIDPGIKNIGVSIFREKKLFFTETYQLTNDEKAQDLVFGIRHMMKHFVEKSKLVSLYTRSDHHRLVIEDQDVRCTKHFPGMAMMSFIELFPWGEIHLVHPQVVARWMSLNDFFEVNGKTQRPKKITRQKKKELTRYWVNMKTGQDFSSFDVCDSIMNFIYADCRIFSKEKLKRSEINNATYCVPANFPCSIDKNEYRSGGNQECEVNTVPNDGSNSLGDTLLRDNGSVDVVDSGKCGELIFSSDDDDYPQLL